MLGNYNSAKKMVKKIHKELFLKQKPQKILNYSNGKFFFEQTILNSHATIIEIPRGYGFDFALKVLNFQKIFRLNLSQQFMNAKN